MFSRVANAAARGPVRAIAARRLSSSAVAAMTSQASSSAFRFAGALAVGAGLVVATKNEDSSPVLCAAASFPYTGAPGTANERSFIVSILLRCFDCPFRRLRHLQVLWMGVSRMYAVTRCSLTPFCLFVLIDRHMLARQFVGLPDEAIAIAMTTCVSPWQEL